MSPPIAPGTLLFLSLRKKSGKWRLLQDLRAINATMEDMEAVKPGLPPPVAIPEGYNMIVIDLKDCFFTIPLNAENRKRFAFSLPSENLTNLLASVLSFSFISCFRHSLKRNPALTIREDNWYICG